MKRIAVTGGAGQIAYSLLFRISAGELFGSEEIALHILDVPGSEKALGGIEMELQDCAFPFLREVRIGVDPYEIFSEVDCAFLIGAKPRTLGMERGDLLLDNGKIFVDQGKALNAVANTEVKVLVVGNPCNTNCLIARSFANRINRYNFFSMTRLDQNRGQSAIARKAGVLVQDVSSVIIWGNHSSTQVPDWTQVKIKGKKAEEVLGLQWLREEFTEGVQKRGAKVIEARGKSSAASAAQAALSSMQDILFPKNGVFSMGIYAKGNPFGINEDIIFSFPCSNKGQVVIEKNYIFDSLLGKQIRATEKELLEEKKMIEPLLGPGA